MRLRALAMMAILAATVSGCVSASTYKDKVGEVGALNEQIAQTLEQLQAEQAAKQEVQQALDAANASLEEAGRTQHNLEVKLAEVKGNLELSQRASEEMRNERDMLQSKVDELDSRSRDLASELDTQRSLVAQLQEDKKRLMGGATTAQEEIARIQQRSGELEVIAARVPDLERRLSQRDEEVGQLRQATSDQEMQMARLMQERDQLSAQLRRHEELLESEAAEKARLQQERAEKEAEIARLTRTHADLRKSLEDEISKGNIRIQQVRDRLTINMVDKVLFSSGQARVKPAGLKVLDEVGAILTNVHDKQIRVEGHTDNVPIGARLKNRFPTNWELSSARATSVVRYLIDKGLVESGSMSAIGYADTRPVAENETEDGRKANRRIEIVLYPKDLSEIASAVNP
jgi:chemotaxis protein MotB